MGPHSLMGFKDGWGEPPTVCISCVSCSRRGSGFAHQTSGLDAEREGDFEHRWARLSFGRLVWRLSRPFSRRFRGRWQGGEGTYARASRGAFAFLVQCGSSLGSVAFPVFATASSRIRVRTIAFWQPAGMRSCARSECWRSGVGGIRWRPGPLALSRGDPVSAVGSNVISQVLGGFVDTGESEGAL